MGYIVSMPNLPAYPPPLFIADNLALDFINSAFGVDAAHRECLVDDAAVMAWLQAAGAAPADADMAPEGLLELALRLRGEARALLDAATSGGGADADAVNHVLSAGQAMEVLEWDRSDLSFRMTRQPRQHDAASLLEPVARSIATLVVDTPLEQVRQCEAHDCTLLFHDQTRSHRRRWCSMALCGNRMKVAAFRARQAG